MSKVNVKQAAVFGLLSVLIVGFIFWHSAQPAQQSNELSTDVMGWFQGLLRALFASDEQMHKFVRKAAHFIEFAALGGCLGLFTGGIRKRFWRSWALFLPLFITLLVAVCDEFIQSFYDRTSAVKDVLLDFCGGVTGIAASVILLCVLAWRKRRRD